MWEQLKRIIKPNGAIVLFGSQPFTSALIMSNVKMFKYELLWLKTRPTNVFNAKKMFMKWHENIAVFYNTLPTYNPQMRTDGVFSGKKVQRNNHDRGNGIFRKTGEKKDYVHEGNGGLFYPKTSIEISNVHHGEHALHPTQKPVALLEYLIKTYTNEGETVLDFTAGSGTTGVAAINTNRNAILIEREPEYCEIIKRRIAETEPPKNNVFTGNNNDNKWLVRPTK
jgi:site-specific DNA-methyltransferase (adenine-specific)